MNYGTTIPAPQLPLVNPATGLISAVWFRYLLSLFGRTGGAPGVNATDLQATLANVPSAATSVVGSAVLSWPSAAGASLAAGTYELVLAWPWQTGAIIGLTGDIPFGSFTVAVQINGIPVAGLGGVLINSPVPTKTLAGMNALVPGNNVTVVVSAVSGTVPGFSADFSGDFVAAALAPTDVTLQLDYLHPLFSTGGFSADFNPLYFVTQ